MDTFKAGVIQFDVKKGQIQFNLDTVFGYLEDLAGQGVSLAVLPEMFSCSFDNARLKVHAENFLSVLDQLSGFAKDNTMAIAGTLPELEDDKIYNTMVLIDTQGRLIHTYRKLHLFRLTKEHHFYGAGNQIGLVDTEFGRLGLMICYDLRFPELARQLMLEGAQMILVSAQWPAPRKNHWQTLATARAIENQCYVICSNRTGSEDDLVFPGMSMVVDPWGRHLVEAGSTPGCFSALIDLEQVQTARDTIPCRTDRRTDIYG